MICIRPGSSLDSSNEFDYGAKGARVYNMPGLCSETIARIRIRFLAVVFTVREARRKPLLGFAHGWLSKSLWSLFGSLV